MTTSNFSVGEEIEKEKEFGRDDGGQDEIARSARNSREESTKRECGADGDERVDDGEPDVEKKVDEPPNGGYGWVCVACLFVMNGHTWGLNSSYAVFLAYYLSNNVFEGATRLDYAFIGGLSISQALIVAPVATMTTRIWGTRTTLLIGVFFETLSFIASSFVNQIWQLFLTQGICFGWGIGFMFVGSVGIPPQWFTTRRSLANGISASGSGIGGLIYSLAAQAMIKSIGLPWAFRVLGIICCVVTFTCAMLVKDRNKQVGSNQLSFDISLFKKIEFICLIGFGFFSMLGYVVLLFSLPNYARTQGLTAKQGSIIGAVLNLGQALGRPPIGYFSDSFGRINMATTMTFLSGLFALVIWMFAHTFGVLLFYAILGGMVAGTYWAVVSPVTAEIMGLVDVPSSLSITWLVLVLPTTFSEAIALEIVSFNGGSYTGAICFAGFMYIGAAMCLWFARAWKIGDLEEKAHALGLKERDIDPATSKVLQDAAVQGTETPEFKKSAFVRRMLMWQKV